MTHNVAVALRLRGPLEPAALRAAFEDVSLASVSFPVVSEQDLPVALGEAARQVRGSGPEPSAEASLFRAGVGEHVLLVVLHSARGSRPQSLDRLLSDLGAAYRARLSGRAPARSQPLAGMPEQLELPADRPRPATLRRRGEVIERLLPRTVQAGILALAAECGTTPFTVIQAALAALLTRLGAGTDVPIGSMPRCTDAESGHFAGFAVDPVILRTDTSGNPGFRQLISRALEADLAPFEQVVEVVSAAKPATGPPLSRVCLDVSPGADASWDFGEVSIEIEPMDILSAWTDLAFFVRERQDEEGAAAGLSVRLGFAADLIDRGSAEALVARLERVLRSAVSDPDRRLGDLEVLAPEDREQILRTSSGAIRQLPASRSIQDRFAEQVRRTPEAVAVSAGAVSLSYAQLNARANRLARRLIELGAAPETCVAVLQQRSIDLVVSILAILKAGGTYVPLHTGYSPAWMKLVIEDTRAALILTDRALGRPAFSHEASVIVVDDEPASGFETDPVVASFPEQLAYVMYTSGSTGVPKGVGITHRDVLSLAADACWHPGSVPCSSERVLLHSPHAFDASTFELWAPLLSGHQIVVAPPGDLDSRELEKVLVEGRVTGAMIVAGLLRLMAEECPHAFAGLREVWSGGDVISPAAVRRVLDACPDTTVTATYGPTEITLCCTRYRISHPRQVEDTVVMGAPMDGRRIYVLDENLNLVPPGVPGEVHIAGAGLARGYVNRLALTAERFVADPFGPPGSRMYRTGDLARWTSDGYLVFSGRADRQVKIRGFRVEAGEVEAALAGSPGVAQAAVGVRPDPLGDNRLVAWVVPVAGAVIEVEALRERVAARLPAYMMPAVVVVPGLPLTPNAKIDFKALPDPDFTPQLGSRSARTPLEEILCDLCADILGLPGVGPKDSFFELGGHSLLATRLVNRIRAALDCELGIEALFAAPTMAGLAERIAQGTKLRAVLRARDQGGDEPLSPAQHRLWFLDRLEEQGPAYNIPLAVRLSGPLDVPALRRAADDVIERHEILRTVVHEIDGEPFQHVLGVGDIASVLGEVVEVDQAEAELAVHRAARTIFDLTADLPVKMTLFRLRPQDHLLVIVLHHIAGDGQSLLPLCDDLGVAYAARLSGTRPACDPLPVQYADYTDWQRRLLGDERDPDSLASRQLAFWRTALDGVPQQLSLPGRRSQETVAGDGARVFEHWLDADLHGRMAELARESRVTLFMVMQAALAATLTKLGAGADIPIGAPISGRASEALDQLVGFFVNTVMLRTDTSGDPTFRDLLARVRARDLAVYANQDVPFDRVVALLAQDRDDSRNPQFQLVLAFDNVAEVALPLPGLTASGRVLTTGRPKCDLWLGISETRDEQGRPAGMRIVAEYATMRHDLASAASLVERLERLLTAAVAQPDQRLSRIEVLGPGERHELLKAGTGSARKLPAGTLIDRFEAHVAETPAAIAVVAADTQLSYAELNVQANRYAHLLIARGMGPEDIIAIALSKSAPQLAMLLAIWKAGAAFLPLDPTYPAERIASMLGDAQPSLVIAEDATASLAEAAGAPVLRIDSRDFDPYPATNPVGADLRASPHADHAAYVIYTSGSTGRPKGVVVSHRGIPNLAATLVERFDITAASRVLQFASLSFDASVSDIASTFTAGGTVVLGPSHRDEMGAAFLEFLASRRVTNATVSPSLLASVPPGASIGGDLATVVVAGEACPPDTAARWSRGRRMLNAYGPTESTVCATMSAPLSGAGVPPIGRPIQNTRVYVLDQHLAMVPSGVAGELYIAGLGLARGYLRRPGLSAERFIADPFGPPGARMYRTGDIARWNADGDLEFAGRADHQVKIRGFRVELGEITATINRYPSVSDSVVKLREDDSGEFRLVAYVLARQAGAVDLDELRGLVAAALPEYMVPAAFVALAAWPLSPNGKLDETALPDPDLGRPRGGRPPRTDREAALCELFCEVLGLAEVGIDEDFFSLGGHSLMATRLVSKIRSQLSVGLSMRTLFAHPTVALLAEKLEGADAAGPRPRLRRPPDAQP